MGTLCSVPSCLFPLLLQNALRYRHEGGMAIKRHPLSPVPTAKRRPFMLCSELLSRQSSGMVMLMIAASPLTIWVDSSKFPRTWQIYAIQAHSSSKELGRLTTTMPPMLELVFHYCSTLLIQPGQHVKRIIPPCGHVAQQSVLWQLKPMLQGPQGDSVRGGLGEMCADTAHLAEQVRQVGVVFQKPLNHQIEDVGQAWHVCEVAEMQSRHQVTEVVAHDHARLEAQRRKPEGITDIPVKFHMSIAEIMGFIQSVCMFQIFLEKDVKGAEQFLKQTEKRFQEILGEKADSVQLNVQMKHYCVLACKD
ncbi:hypothetical protein GDO78_015754 [Eleutherodactylus coqui]|uniref:Uncharacterized protein n=1 Tax=Eleutherodactylus coqui TaxID=57060 RepID=A0A8J6EDB0_ELECQ|nr:hypothetical protein GDO78_015754 [Eleutherodactylus coqui]